MFFHFSQNNSGGEFAFDEAAGISRNVVIEADTAEAANARLEAIGGYFKGVESDRDCPCCGDRWRRAYDDEGDDYPSVYGCVLGQECDHQIAFMPTGRETVVHYADGRIEWYGANGLKA